MIPCAAKPRLAAKAKKETGYSIIIIWDLHEHLQAFLHPAAGRSPAHSPFSSDSGQGHTRFERAIRLWVAEKWEREKTL
jgi:hypothetical protein